MQTKSTSHCKYNIWYHLVFCTKYRKSILTDSVEVETKKLLAEICATQQWEVGGLEVMPDHIHLFISAPPTVAPTILVQILKSISAITLFQKFPGLKRRSFWGSGLWSKGYYVGTAGTVTAETIKKYIENQKHT